VITFIIFGEHGKIQTDHRKSYHYYWGPTYTYNTGRKENGGVDHAQIVQQIHHLIPGQVLALSLKCQVLLQVPAAPHAILPF
jgi:hypothetical protein